MQGSEKEMSKIRQSEWELKMKIIHIKKWTQGKRWKKKKKRNKCMQDFKIEIQVAKQALTRFHLDFH